MTRHAAFYTVEIVELEPFVVPLLSEGDLDRELHLVVVNVVDGTQVDVHVHDGRRLAL